ncbi:MAG: hypothetical protein GXP13_01180 [Gammaproteobacteria bacterium]|nr:hypothetical protein [Gammaproteobacteria bacterium]
MKEKPPSTEKNLYDGAERRYAERRGMHDRRAMIRFELGKEDRRDSQDRRITSAEIWDKGHTMF